MRIEPVLLCGAALLLGGAAFYWPGQGSLLVGVMLFWPLVDRGWRLPALPKGRGHYLAWAVLLGFAGGLLIGRSEAFSFFVSTLLFAALPEEWFFRAWFMTRLGSSWSANLATSVFFSLIHAMTQGPTRGVLVFVPSLCFGWLFQRSRDLPLNILIHALANLFYFLYLAHYEARLLERFFG